MIVLDANILGRSSAPQWWTARCEGARITDAQLAALTVEYGGELQTTDRDFARFPGLLWVNPLHTPAAR